MVKELIRNGGFERGDMDFWEVTTGIGVLQTAEVKRGTYAIYCTIGDIPMITVRCRDYLPIHAGEVYKLSGWFKSVDALGVTYAVFFYDSDYNYITGGDITAVEKAGVFDWTLLKDFFIAPEEASYMRASFAFAGSEDDTGYADSLSLELIDISKLASDIRAMVSVTNLTTKDTYYSSTFFTGIWKQAEYHLYCTSLTGTSPTLDVTIQGYDPNTEQWKDVMVFQQLDAAGGEFKTLLSGLGWKQRVKYVLAGTTVTDCDFKVGVVYKR